MKVIATITYLLTIFPFIFGTNILHRKKSFNHYSALAEALLEEERFIERPVGTGGTKKGDRTVEKQGRGDRKAERSMDRTGGRADRSMERMVKERPGKGERGGTVERLLETGNGGGGAVEVPKNKKGGPNNGQAYPSMSPEKRLVAPFLANQERHFILQ